MDENNKRNREEFGQEVSLILPLIMREFTRSQHSGQFSKVPLTMPQMLILEFLGEREICKMSDLAKGLNLNMSAATAIIDKMIEMRLVRRERSSVDRRVVNVIMLSKGKDMLEKSREAKIHCLDQLFAPLSDEDRSEYLRLLRKVYDNLRKGK